MFDMLKRVASCGSSVAADIVPRTISTSFSPYICAENGKVPWALRPPHEMEVIYDVGAVIDSCASDALFRSHVFACFIASASCGVSGPTTFLSLACTSMPFKCLVCRYENCIGSENVFKSIIAAQKVFVFPENAPDVWQYTGIFCDEVN